jgi:hypothetical protein
MMINPPNDYLRLSRLTVVTIIYPWNPKRILCLVSARCLVAVGMLPASRHSRTTNPGK